MSTWPLLSLLIWLPILGGFAVLAAGPRLSRPVALAISLLVLLLIGTLLLPFIIMLIES